MCLLVLIRKGFPKKAQKNLVLNVHAPCRNKNGKKGE